MNAFRLVRAGILTTLLCMFICVGCTSNGDEGGAGGSNGKSSQQLSDTPIPSDSPFAKLRYGMGQKEVSDLIGQPTDQEVYMTGKTWVPFYYGSDHHRSTWIYKGAGKIAFNSKGRLIKVKPDSSEDGYR